MIPQCRPLRFTAPVLCVFIRAVFARPSEFSPMRAFALATTAVAVLALAVPVRAQTTDPVVAIVNGTQLKKSDLEAAYATPARPVPADAAGCDLRSAPRSAGQQHAAAGPANQEKLDDDPQVKAQIARAHDGVLRDAVIKKAIDKGVTDEKLQRGLRDHEEPARASLPRRPGPRTSWSRTRRRRWRSSSSCRVGRTSRRWPRRSRPIPRPRPTAATSAISNARRWCPSSPRPHSPSSRERSATSRSSRSSAGT